MDGFSIVRSSDALWLESEPMRLSNADLGDQVGATMVGARLWRLPPGRALAKYVRAGEEEIYVLLAGEGKLRVDAQIVAVGSALDAILVRPGAVRQPFNDTDAEVLWLVIASGAGARDVSFPDDPRRLPPELGGGRFVPDEV